MMDRAAVVNAGAETAQRLGLDAVGVRAVANTLRVTPMAIYRHVRDVETLRASVIEYLLEALPPVPADGDWDERCRTWAAELRVAVSRTPGLARHLMAHWTELAPSVVMLNDLAKMLEDLGPDGIDVVAASNALFSYVLARIQMEEVIGAEGQRLLTDWEELGEAAAFLNEHRQEYEAARVDEHFAFGLDALLAGFAVVRSRRARGST